MRAVFLDRDGVINRKAPEGEYISKWNDMRFFPGIFKAALDFQRAGFKLVVITNQRGVSLRKVQLKDLEEIHTRTKAAFARHGVVITDIYCCLHDISDNCSCRKPKPGLLLQAAMDHALDLRSCWMIGDAPSDIEAGRNAGCKTLRILSRVARIENGPKPDITARDLPSAARKVLNWPGSIL
jgi:D-glycero-D-manno-heptose 1,7-bisphosphate phosphatase